LPILAILALSFAVYYTALSNAFVYDDDLQVLKNSWITDIKSAPEAFSRSVWSFQSAPVVSNYYRPLMHVIYMLTYRLFGLSPFGFHLVNMLFHAAVSVLVFFIALTLFRDTRIGASVSLYASLMAALLFAAHPVHTEAVTWVAALPEVSFAFFSLLSFYLYLPPSEDRPVSSRAPVLSLVFFFIAALCKETALTLPVLLIAYDFAFGKIPVRFPAAAKRYGPYLFIAGLYFLMRFIALGGLAPQKRYEDLNAVQLLLNVFPLFMEYLGKLLLPVNLNAFHVFHPVQSLHEARAVFSLLVVAAFLALTWVGLRRQRTVFLSLLFLVIPLLPVFYIPALGENVFTERYLYLPSVGFVMFLGFLIVWTKVTFRKGAVIAYVIPIAILGLYCTATIARNAVWKDDYTLFSDTVRKSPDAVIPHYNLATAYLKQKRPDKVIEESRIVLRLNPNLVEARALLGTMYAEGGRTEEAIAEFRTAVRLNPDSALAHFSLGTLYDQRGDLDGAIKEYLAALRLRPDVAEGHNNLGLAYEKEGYLDRAAEEFRTATRLQPDFAEAHHNLGVTYARENRIPEAMTEIETAIRLKPDFQLARENYKELTRQHRKTESASGP
jgi:tetratricopeptide (TPR) repeat protein